jgi:hypothetical protein
MEEKRMIFQSALVTPAIDLGMRSLCVYPYHNHPKGCPNFGKKATCPPTVGRFPYEYDNRHDVWALWAEFDLDAHVRRMRKRHPTWTYRQLSCCLYWQGTVRKFLRESIAKWVGENKEDYPNLAVTTCPEGMGVNVTATMKSIGVELEWPPRQTTRLIYLAGVLK